MTSLAEQYGICDKKAYDKWADAHQADAIAAMIEQTRAVLAEQAQKNAACLRRASLHREQMLRRRCVEREEDAFAERR